LIADKESTREQRPRQTSSGHNVWQRADLMNGRIHRVCNAALVIALRRRVVIRAVPYCGRCYKAVPGERKVHKSVDC